MLNQLLSNLGTANFWNHLTDIIVALALLNLATIAICALHQWIKRKSFTKIDRELRWTLLPFSLMAATYLIFEKIFILSYRPLASGKPWEPSFPSTHTMLTATVFFVTIVLLPKYVKSRAQYYNLSAAMLLLTALVAVGRVLAGMHWPTDVLGALLFSAIFAVIYALILRRPPHDQPNQLTKHSNPSEPHQSQPQIIQPDHN